MPIVTDKVAFIKDVVIEKAVVTSVKYGNAVFISPGESRGTGSLLSLPVVGIFNYLIPVPDDSRFN